MRLRYQVTIAGISLCCMMFISGFICGYEEKGTIRGEKPPRTDCPYEGIECPNAQQVLKECREGKFVSQFDFKVGDTLLPSYACGDTLLVRNERGLNYGLATCDGSDSGIDSVLHANCDRIDGRKSIVLNDGYGYDYLTPMEIDSISKLYSLNDNR